MSRTDLMRGTLDLLILRALTTGPDHGLGIARRVEQITQGAFRVNPGSLFPALHRLAQKGWLTAEWGRSETNRKAKYYELTPDGGHQWKPRRATGSASRWPSTWRWTPLRRSTCRSSTRCSPRAATSCAPSSAATRSSGSSARSSTAISACWSSRTWPGVCRRARRGGPFAAPERLVQVVASCR